jgi:hypothetical protein
MSQSTRRTHPVHAFAHQLIGRLDDLAATPVWSMQPQERRESLIDLAHAEAQLTALRLRVLAEADSAGDTDDTAACTIADWVAVETRQVRRDARSDLNLARKVEQHADLGAAMAAGAVNADQARVIVRSLDRLPTSGDFAVTPEQQVTAEKHLVGLAADYDAKALARLGMHLFEVIAPEVADQFEGKVLADQEAAALKRTWLTMREDDEGTVHGKFRIPALHGDILSKAILAIASPARPDPDGHPVPEPSAQGEQVSTPVKHGLALCQLLEAIPADKLPSAGGVSATIVVTMTLEQLTASLAEHGVCGLDTGGVITAGEARRLACTAGIIPMVLGGKSEPLDLGRRRRFHSPAQRLAMAHRDGGCTAVDCDRPPSMCHAHHDQPWSHGGGTTVERGRLLCGHHHRRVHDHRYEHRMEPSGRISFHRRT